METSQIPHPVSLPRNILLATDLSCRCDRALDRAANIAAAWDAHLTALTVVDAEALDSTFLKQTSQDDALNIARRRLRKDAATLERPPSLIVRNGEVLDQLLDVAIPDMDLIVTGVARNQWLREVTLGSVVDGLLRRSPLPTLIVRNRTGRDYRHILVASDLTPLSTHLLVTALSYFPNAEITFFHAFEVPYIDLSDANREQVCEQARRTATAEAQAFVSSLPIDETQARRIRIACEYGAPVTALNSHMQRFDTDLVVIGSRSRSVFFEILIGSKSKQIVQHIDCDVLTIPDPEA